MRKLLVYGCFFYLLSPFSADAETSAEYTMLLWQSENSLRQERISSLQRLRLMWQQQSSWLDVHLRYDLSALHGAVVRDPLFNWRKVQPTATWADAEAVIYDHRPWWLTHRLYRGWLQVHHGDWQLSVGRQRIAWGTGRFWNPTDRFNPVSLTALEAEEKTGVDAINGQWNYSSYGSVQAILAPARLNRSVKRKVAVRWRDTLSIGDVSASWLREGNTDMIGVDYAGNLGDAGIRAEYAKTLKHPQHQWIVGVDYNYVSSWFAEGLYLAVEYLFNAVPNPLLNPALSLSSSSLQTRSRQLLAARVGYDLNPLWHLELTATQDLEHRSQFLMPILQWSASDHLELQWLNQWYTGRKGEFAAMNTVSLLRLQYYF